ncbi:hypothetical protein MBAV_004122, partial [Candidatus Magnetobacterium bavaricum]
MLADSSPKQLYAPDLQDKIYNYLTGKHLIRSISKGAKRDTAPTTTLGFYLTGGVQPYMTDPQKRTEGLNFTKWRFGVFTQDGKTIYSKDNIKIPEDIKKHLVSNDSAYIIRSDKQWGKVFATYVVKRVKNVHTNYFNWIFVNEHSTDEVFKQVIKLRVSILVIAAILTLFIV